VGARGAGESTYDPDMNTREDIGTGPGSAATGGKGCCKSGGHDHGHDHDHDHEDGHGCCGGEGSGGGGCCGGGGKASEGVLVFSRRQIRELDRLAVEEFAIPSILLMENAARGVAGVILEGRQGMESPSALVVCGPGNNGGDGLAVARHLVNRGVKIAIVLGAPAGAYKGDALTNLTIAQKMDLPIFDGSKSEAAAGTAMAAAETVLGEPVVLIDALLGTGLDRPATGVMAELIVQMNAMRTRGCTTVAIDVPSGLDCDTGEAGNDASGSGPVVEADLTVALAGVKAGFLTPTAQKHVGELVVVDIGAPRELVSRLGRPLTAMAGEKSGGGGCGSGGCGCKG
jgi:NAD(P)H-hydrate epimerase